MKNKIEIEKVTFAEWWSLICDGTPEYFTLETLDHISIIYDGYRSWCSYRGCEAQTKEEVQAWIREKCNG